MKWYKHIGIWQSIIIVLFMFDCKEQYLPPVLQTNKNYLVVEGVIINGSDSTIIKLSRTSNISDTVLPNPETNSTVSVVADDSSTYQLINNGDGKYYSTSLNLDVSKQYKLVIHTSNGSSYQSDFIPVKQTPPIDSVGWYQDNNNLVNIWVNTHDPANNSRYYRWDYVETWDYESSAASYVDWVNNQLIIRPKDSLIYDCWSNAASSTIQTASSAKLAQDVIFKAPITTVPDGSEKISVRYSILVKQYVLTADAYNFWQSVQTTTQQLGSLFDAQPAKLPSNIHCLTNPAEVVVGFVSASSVQSKRIFIDHHDVRWQYQPYYAIYQCDSLNEPADTLNTFLPPTGPRQWVLMGLANNPMTLEYIIAPAECMDCRLHGGTNIKPPFWQ